MLWEDWCNNPSSSLENTCQINEGFQCWSSFVFYGGPYLKTQNNILETQVVNICETTQNYQNATQIVETQHKLIELQHKIIKTQKN